MAHLTTSAAVLVLVLAALWPGSAGAAACPAGGDPRLRLQVDLPPADIRHTLSRARIGALGGHGHMTSDRRHAGLTQAKTYFTVRPTLAFARRSDGTVCASLKDVEATWRMVQLQVDVAAEYQRGSCPYGEILRHENEHVTIAQTAFREAERRLRRDLATLAARTAPFVIRAADTRRAAQDMAARFMAAAEPALEKYRRDTAQGNAAIDTPENYRAVSARCKDW